MGLAWGKPSKKDMAVIFLTDIIPVTLWMVPAQSLISQRGDHIPPKILNLLMMQKGKSYCEGR